MNYINSIEQVFLWFLTRRDVMLLEFGYFNDIGKISDVDIALHSYDHANILIIIFHILKMTIIAFRSNKIERIRN